jgi:hypothetical protein
MKKVVSVLLVLLLVGSLVGCGKTEKKETGTEGESKVVIDPKLAIVVGHEWLGSDDSLMILTKDGEFYWYKSKDDFSDNYFYGTYTIYHGEKAMDFIDEEFGDIGFSRADQEAMIDYYSDVSIDTYYCIMAVSTSFILDGVEQINPGDDPYETPYYGFYFEEDNSIGLINFNTDGYYEFTFYK